jgi:hypothetical protein
MGTIASDVGLTPRQLHALSSQLSVLYPEGQAICRRIAELQLFDSGSALLHGLPPRRQLSGQPRQTDQQ